MAQAFVFGAEEKSGQGVLFRASRRPGCLEMMLVRRGRISVTTAMCHFEAQEGELFFLAPDFVRTVSSPDTVSVVRSIYFDISFLSDLPESIDRDLFYMFLMQSRTRENRFTPEDPLRNSLVQTFETCYDEYLTRDLCYSLSIRGQIYLMMAQVLSSYSTTRENDRVIYHNVLRLRESLTYMDEHFRAKMTVPALAAFLQVTPDYYTRLFRESIGKTTVDYVNSLRLNRGMILLVETDSSVSDIAREIGLGSGNYFSKLFHAALGTTPLVFRRGALR